MSGHVHGVVLLPMLYVIYRDGALDKALASHGRFMKLRILTYLPVLSALIVMKSVSYLYVLWRLLSAPRTGSLSCVYYAFQMKGCMVLVGVGCVRAHLPAYQ